MPENEETAPTTIAREPIRFLIDPLQRFLLIEAADGGILLVAAAFALVVANSPWGAAYLAFWQQTVGLQVGAFQIAMPMQLWINDGLMAIFFFVVGLEVKREFVLGELREFKHAALPIAAAIGGMVVPAAIYLALQIDTPGERGWGIPMATDIAFVVGCMAILGPRIPNGLRIMLLSLAIADDIGAILVIAIGYTAHLNLHALLLSMVGIALFIGLLKVGIRSNLVFLLVGVWIWFEFHESGIHATVAGVIIGLLTPTRVMVKRRRLDFIIQRTLHFIQGERWTHPAERYAALRQMERMARESLSPLERLETELHPWVGFIIMPLFALANAGVVVRIEDLTMPVATAAAWGLVLGKPIGIVAFSWAAIQMKLARLPEGVGWPSLVGGGMLAGIGFTMALFIAGLALEGELLDHAKIGVMTGSLVSAVAGMAVLYLFSRRPDRKAAGATKP
ncbi:MAG: Na+/H+ antiporter NhaA [Desulfobacterales bacterium]|nr:Na+/H+ antiporter NhaA [Desulfobacterales bacterium]MDJ0886366.1 Na+/H+ antiporter NhaA [Desulfobacterales bacterium]